MVESILTNEKYKGDAILQKCFTVDSLTKKRKANEGEVPQYYVTNGHPSIVSEEVFDLVQSELEKRKVKRYISSTSCLSSRIICGDCGGIYGNKVWHSTSKYRRTIWQCNAKFRNGEKCTTPHLYEDDLKVLFVDAFNSLITDRESVFAAYDDIIADLTDNTAPSCHRRYKNKKTPAGFGSDAGLAGVFLCYANLNLSNIAKLSKLSTTNFK